MDLEAYIRSRLDGDRRVLLMTHVIVGYPSLEANRAMLAAMADADVDLDPEESMSGAMTFHAKDTTGDAGNSRVACEWSLTAA